MKVAYLSTPFFSDVDFSLIQKLNNKADLYYFLNLTPYSLNTAAININKQFHKSGIFSAKIYPEIENYRNFIDLEKTFIINRVDKKGLSLKNFILSFKIVLKLLKLDPDIIHITYYLQYPEFLYYIFRRKMVLTVHDPFTHSGESSLKDKIYRKVAYRNINNFILLNENQKKEFIEKNKLYRKNVFISKLSVYTYLKNFSVNGFKHQNYILFFGRISPYKGLEYLFEAMKNLHKTNPELKLIVAGSGKYYFETKEYENIDSIKILNRYIPVDELAELIKNALFIVCPYTDATQSGVVMSAYAFCKPVVGTNVGGMPEYIEHNITGLLIQPKNTAAIQSAIIELVNDKDKLKRFEANIKEIYYEKDFSWDVITKKLIEIYHQIIQSN